MNRLTTTTRRCCAALGMLLAISGITFDCAAQAIDSPPSHGRPSQLSVIFNKGLLTIEAENTTLGAVLADIRSRTRGTIEFPASADAELVAVRLGPAPPTKVIADLLLGSHFDYVVIGTGEDPGRFFVRLAEGGSHFESTTPSTVELADVPSTVPTALVPVPVSPTASAARRTLPYGGRTMGAAIGDVLGPMDNSDLPVPQPKKLRIPKEGPRSLGAKAQSE